MDKNVTQTGLRFPPDLMDKIKYIASKERRSINNTVIIGMEEFVADWEAQNETADSRDKILDPQRVQHTRKVKK